MASPNENNTPHFVTKALPPPHFFNYPASVQPYIQQPRSIAVQRCTQQQQPMLAQQQPMFTQQQPVFPMQQQPVQPQPLLVQQPQPLLQPMRTMGSDLSQQLPMQQIQNPQLVFNPYEQSPTGTPPVIARQPTSTMPMSYAPGGGNRNAKNMPIAQDGRDWSFDLFDCFQDSATCLLAWCFPSLLYGKNKSRLEHLHTKGYPHPHQGDMCNSDCMLHYGLFCCGCACFLQMDTRSQIRNRYHIRDKGDDFFVAWCCTPCELTQESQELALEEQSFNHLIQ